jgi:adenosylmethionine-8-amino-7-oxononanoate aminotransferase
MVEEISNLSCVKRVTCIGTIFAVELSISQKADTFTRMRYLIALLRQEGIYIRPIGKTIYLLISLLTSKDEAERSLIKILKGLKLWSNDIS